MEINAEYFFVVCRHYYQGNSEFLSMCTLTVHAILHVADDIENNGPCCYNWSWVMERWCGSLAPAVKSRFRPFASIALRQRHRAELQSVGLRYHLTDLLSLDPLADDDDDSPTEFEQIYDECKLLSGIGARSFVNDPFLALQILSPSSDPP